MGAGFRQKAFPLLLGMLLVGVLLTGCASQGGEEAAEIPPASSTGPAATELAATPEAAEREERVQEEREESVLNIQIGDFTFIAAPADTQAAVELLDLLADGPVTIPVENYGGFEKVGSLPQALPQQDSRITTRPGDIMLYQGDSIAFFYGSNTWAYTPLAAIQEASEEELRQAFSGSETTITLSR